MYKKATINKHISAGKRAFNKQEYVNALIEFNKVKEINPNSKVVKNWINKITRELEKPYLKIVGNKNVARNFKTGLNHLRNGNYPKAIYTWKRILKLSPGNKQVISYLNKTKRKLNQEINLLLKQADQHWKADEKAIKNLLRAWQKFTELESIQKDN